MGGFQNPLVNAKLFKTGVGELKITLQALATLAAKDSSLCYSSTGFPCSELLSYIPTLYRRILVSSHFMLHECY